MSYTHTVTGPHTSVTASATTSALDTSSYLITGGTVGTFTVPLGTNVYGGGGSVIQNSIGNPGQQAVVVDNGITVSNFINYGCLNGGGGGGRTPSLFTFRKSE